MTKRPRVLSAEHLTAAADPGGFPSPTCAEVAFAGRSNVGKSSLLNRLVGRRNLAFTSRTPGRTRLVHFYTVRRAQGPLVLVDLPGYGYARVSREERARWKTLVEGYLEDRAALRGVILLLDVRRDPGPDELDLCAWLAERAVPVRIVLTKVDKLPAGPRAGRLRELVRQLGVEADALVSTSASRGLGIDALWAAIDALPERSA